MSKTLESLVIALDVDNAELKRKISESDRSLGKFSSDARRNIDSLSTSAKKLGAALGAAFAVAKLRDFAGAAIALGDSLSNTSERIGLTAEQLQKLHAAAEPAGTSAEKLDGALLKLSKGLGDARIGGGALTKALEETHPQLLASLSAASDTGEAFLVLADAVARIEDPAERVRVAQAALGRSGAELVNVLGQGRAAIEAQGEEMQRLGGIVSNEGVAALDTFGDALGRLSTVALAGFANGLTATTGGARDLTSILSDPATIEGISSTAREIGRITSELGKLASLAGPVFNVIDILRTPTGQLQSRLFGPDFRSVTGGSSSTTQGRALPPPPGGLFPPLRGIPGGGGGGGGRRSRASQNAAPKLDSSIINFDYFAAEKASFTKMVEDFDKGFASLRKASDAFAEEGAEHFRKMESAAESFGSFAGNIFGNFVRDRKLDFKSLGLSFAETIVEMSARLAASSLFKAVGNAGGGAGGGFLATLFSGIGSILGLADGGVVTRPTLAMIGEGGEPEAVIPLSKMKQRAPVVNIINSGAPLEVTGTRRNERDEIDVMVESSWNRQRSRGAFKSALGSRHAPGPG